MSKRNPKPTPEQVADKIWNHMPDASTKKTFSDRAAPIIAKAIARAEQAQMERDFDIAFAEDAVAAWEIRGAFDKRRGIVRVPGFRTKAT